MAGQEIALFESVAFIFDVFQRFKKGRLKSEFFLRNMEILSTETTTTTAPTVTTTPTTAAATGAAEATITISATDHLQQKPILLRIFFQF